MKKSKVRIFNPDEVERLDNFCSENSIKTIKEEDLKFNYNPNDGLMILDDINRYHEKSMKPHINSILKKGATLKAVKLDPNDPKLIEAINKTIEAQKNAPKSFRYGI